MTDSTMGGECGCIKRFNVDNTCAMKDLRKIGALSPEKRAEMQQAERLRLEQKRREREQTMEEYIHHS